MKNTKCLIVTCGFFGDIAFAGSLAEKLQSRYDQIDYLIGFPQMYRLMSNNPFINKVYVSEFPSPHPVSSIDRNSYDKIIQLQSLNYVVTPCEEYQITAGIETPNSEYMVYTQPEYDKVAQTLINDLREQYGKPVVALMSNWQPKTYLYTEEQYKQGIDVPNLGYGGKHRDINFIVNGIREYFTFYEVGVGNLNQQQTSNIAEDDSKSLLFEASVLKYCDAFLGTDGGLATIAAGVGTKTIITGDFNLQLYGWNGVLKKIEQPKLGPEYYFPKVGHVTLNPYYNDKQVIEQILKIFNLN
jgi:hypothetical protein